jgi:WD40 repeat protein
MTSAKLLPWAVVILAAAALLFFIAFATAPRWRAHYYGGPANYGAPVSDEAPLVLHGHSRGVNGVAFSPDGKRLASAGGDGDASVKIWDSETGRLFLTLDGHDRGIYDVAYSPDGKLLASAGHDHTVVLWDATTGKPIRTIKGLEIHVMGVAFRPDAAQLATADGDGVRIWDVETGREALASAAAAGRPSLSEARSVIEQLRLLIRLIP